jgi:hypothetical protein
MPDKEVVTTVTTSFSDLAGAATGQMSFIASA